MKQEQSQNQQPGTHGPAPVENAPYEQQPVNQQYFAQPQAAPVQYVVQSESLKGVKGWLLFFAIIFALAGIGYIGMFFTALEEPLTSIGIVNLIFSPILAILSIATVVLIAMQKKIARWLAIGAFGVIALVGTITNIIDNTDTTPALISGIIIGWLFAGLMSLYFVSSRRVKETLVG